MSGDGHDWQFVDVKDRHVSYHTHQCANCGRTAYWCGRHAEYGQHVGYDRQWYGSGPCQPRKP